MVSDIVELKESHREAQCMASVDTERQPRAEVDDDDDDDYISLRLISYIYSCRIRLLYVAIKLIKLSYLSISLLNTIISSIEYDSFSGYPGS